MKSFPSDAEGDDGRCGDEFRPLERTVGCDSPLHVPSRTGLRILYALIPRLEAQQPFIDLALPHDGRTVLRVVMNDQIEVFQLVVDKWLIPQLIESPKSRLAVMDQSDSKPLTMLQHFRLKFSGGPLDHRYGRMRILREP